MGESVGRAWGSSKVCAGLQWEGTCSHQGKLLSLAGLEGVDLQNCVAARHTVSNLRGESWHCATYHRCWCI